MVKSIKEVVWFEAAASDESRVIDAFQESFADGAVRGGLADKSLPGFLRKRLAARWGLDRQQTQDLHGQPQILLTATLTGGVPAIRHAIGSTVGLTYETVNGRISGQAGVGDTFRQTVEFGTLGPVVPVATNGAALLRNCLSNIEQNLGAFCDVRSGRP